MRLTVAALAAALCAPAVGFAVDRAHWINAISIGRAELGYRQVGYTLLFGEEPEKDVTRTHFLVHRFPERRIAVYFRRGVDHGAAVVTWNRDDVTLDDVGPCSKVDDFLRAYREPPPPAIRRAGRVVAYRLGRLVWRVVDDRVANVMLALPSVPVQVALDAPRCT